MRGLLKHGMGLVETQIICPYAEYKNLLLSQPIEGCNLINQQESQTSADNVWFPLFSMELAV